MKENELLLLRLVELMFEKEQTFLLIDELYEDEIIGTYIRNIQIDSPYQQLLFEGVISQFLQGEELVVCITVENYFHHLLGLILQKDDRYQSSESLIQLIKSNNLKGLKEGVSNLLNLDIELGNFDRITELIDLSDGDETVTGICVTPLVNALLIHGVEKTIEVILENPTENDWKVLFDLDSKLDELQLYILREKYLTELMPNNPLNTKNTIWLGLKALTVFNKSVSLKYLSKLDVLAVFFQEDADLLFQLGVIEDTFGNFNKSLEFYDKCLAIRLNILGGEHPDVASSFNNIGSVWFEKGKYDKALIFFEKSLEINLKTFGDEHPAVATSYNNIGAIWIKKGVYDKALEFYEKSLKIRLIYFGGEHPSIANSQNNIGFTWDEKGNYEKSIEFYKKCLIIRLKTFGEEHPSVAISYNNIGAALNNKGEYDKALEYYTKCLEINLKLFGEEHPTVSTSYNNIGLLWKKKDEYEKALVYYDKCLSISLKILGEEHHDVAITFLDIGCTLINLKRFYVAIENFQKGYQIEKLGGYPFKIAQCYEALNEKENALDYYIQSAEIRKEDPDLGIKADSTQESISNSIRLAIELDKENELPDWIKNLN